ncbi:MAG: hypothetical protein R3185_03385 [Candidatus Thermoplasmatota archaeon]|nr:hypothetical protein [Candidatus Thermoplasmatota archaeon]
MVLDLQPFRDAASVHVDATPERVRELLVHPSVMRALDPRIPTDRPLDIVKEGDTVEVRDLEGHVHFAFRLEQEGEGTRLAAVETVRPTSAVEATKHLFFPGRHHRELKVEMDKLRDLLEEL